MNRLSERAFARAPAWHFAAAIYIVMLSGCGGDGGGGGGSAAPPPPPQLSVGPATCAAGRAGDFACQGISLHKRVPLESMGGTQGNDIWGWFDPQSGDEYALVGLTNGTAFVNVTNPENPVFLGRLPTATVGATWRDIKVYQNHAYVVADGAGQHGMQVFDLTRLRSVTSAQNFAADVVYGDFGSAHNIAINEATGFAYAVETNTCGGGLHIIDIGIPISPMFAGCHATVDTHDTQCVVYQGPDPNHQSHEVCISSNVNHVEVVDVTTKSAPVTLSTAVYPQLGFLHQGWLTEDHRYFLVGDETDEVSFNVPTRTHVFDLSDLDAPQYVFAYEAPTRAIDHNLYVLGNRVFEANYTSGLRVLQFGDLANEELQEIAFFDTFPASDAAEFDGAWNVYPYLPSGTLIVNDVTNGLFILSNP
ncbi:MAG: choice-of-anchor B family protein [Gammaproteobacteria bacterium]|nr:MAG: choice-of-anchor B family protein [Gammaproteobacteria bacterium]